MLITRHLGLQPYLPIWQQMQTFTAKRNSQTQDELWLLEHLPVYTQGQAGKAEHLLHSNHIPLVLSDRGGQITYHGPGQLIVYILMDLKRRNLGVRTLVRQLEEIIIKILALYKIDAKLKPNAPGVYVQDKKIASIGLRVKQGCTYHGVALNVNMDLIPFENINPCGYKTLKMTQMSDYITNIHLNDVKASLEQAFSDYFRY